MPVGLRSQPPPFNPARPGTPELLWETALTHELVLEIPSTRVLIVSQSQAFFEARYQASSDPWHFASSTYELNRYRATLEALSRACYRRGFEPGCSVGVLTAALARRVDHLNACDISPTAVACAVLHGDEVHGALAQALPCQHVAGSRHAGFRIDSWRKAP